MFSTASTIQLPRDLLNVQGVTGYSFLDHLFSFSRMLDATPPRITTDPPTHPRIPIDSPVRKVAAIKADQKGVDA